MNFDIRLPIGAMFSILGVLLLGYGLISGPEIYQRSLGINMNVAWGAVLLIFGFSMLALAWFASRVHRPATSARTAPVSGSEKRTHA
jgi:multisubunit Na+/H+ antiporter MnhG subunit